MRAPSEAHFPQEATRLALMAKSDGNGTAIINRHRSRHRLAPHRQSRVACCGSTSHSGRRTVSCPRNRFSTCCSAVCAGLTSWPRSWAVGFGLPSPSRRISRPPPSFHSLGFIGTAAAKSGSTRAERSEASRLIPARSISPSTRPIRLPPSRRRFASRGPTPRGARHTTSSP